MKFKIKCYICIRKPKIINNNMKEFFKYAFATVVGIIIFGLIMTFFSVISIVGMVASGSQTQNAPKNSVLVLNMSGVIQEKASENILGQITGDDFNNIGLDEILSAIKKAKTNKNIKGIYIESGIMESDYATIQEIRNALKDFKTSHKWIVSYGDQYTQGAYYLASVADKVYLNPQGTIDWHGIAAQPQFLKDLYAKFGVKFQVVKVGTYKSFTEQYTEEKMSAANREQVTLYINGLWSNVCKAVSESRGISVDSLNAYADRMVSMEDPANLKKYKMVDGLLYADQMKKEVKKLLGIDNDESISQISLADMNNIKEDENDGDEIAVYYAAGEIVESSTTGIAVQGDKIVAQDVCKDIEDLMNDDDVKAVVFRINSGGGDAYASEQLWHQISELKKRKPVVVSMGGMAASGAYYMSCNADWIVAQPNTLTGSIGIFGAFPDFSGLLTQKLGVKFDEVKTNKNSGFSLLATARPFNAEEVAYLQNMINRGYKLFRQRVCDGRRQSVASIEKVAQGHVWLGQDAIKIKLVDQLGGLDDAIAKAAKLAELKSYYTENYPEPEDWMSQLLDGSSRNSYLDNQLRLTLGDYYGPFMLLRDMSNRQPVQARLPMILNVR